MIQKIEKERTSKYLVVYVDVIQGLSHNISLFDTPSINGIKLVKDISEAFDTANLITPNKNSQLLQNIHFDKNMFMTFIDMSIECDTIYGEVIVIDARELPEEFIICTNELGLTFIGHESNLPDNISRRGIKVYNENPVFKYEGLK